MDEISKLDVWFRDCDALEKKCHSRHLAGKDSFDTACWRTMVWDQGMPDLYSSYRAYRKMCQAAADGRGVVDEDTTKNAYDFRVRFHSIGYGTQKAMVITESGRLVSGPAATQAGDNICIIAGAKVLFILRQNDGGEGYRIVGECFVDGLMGGEVSRLEGLKFDDMEVR
jgi:hypothetical protein